MIESHQYANLFPIMDEDRLAELAESIKTQGQHDPIIILDGAILDGRNRYRACEIAGVEPITKEFDGDDPLGWVIAHNLTRRHLTESQRGMVAGRIAKLKHGGDRGNQHTGGKGPIGPLPPSNAEAAKMMSVSPRTVKRAKSVQRNAIPEVQDAVERGDLSLHAANQIAKLKRHEQSDTFAESGIDGLVEKVKEVNKPKQSPESMPDSKIPNVVLSDAIGHAVNAISFIEKITDKDTQFSAAMDMILKHVQKRIDARK